MKKLLFIYNPGSGTGIIKKHLSAVVEETTKAGYDVTIHPTQGPSDAFEQIIGRGEQFDVVLCSGGDGTVNEIVNGIMMLQKKPVLGLLPTGTVNDFAKSLGISPNPSIAVKCATKGRVYKCDAGIFGSRYFNYVAAFGAFTQVSYETPQKNKNALGRLAYFIDALRLLPALKSYHVVCNADDREFEGDYIYGMVSNSKSVGGFQICDRKHRVSLNDGKMEVVLIKNPQNPIEFEQVIQAAITHDTSSPWIDSCKASHIRIQSQTGIKWTLDGEKGGETTDVSIECLKAAIRVFVKKDYK